MTGLEWLFWAGCGLVVYAYFGYPALLYALSRVRHRAVHAADITPSVAFIVTVRNEAQRIQAKLDNTLALDYPRDRLDTIVASDASTDATHDLVQAYADRGVRLIVSPSRLGKESAQLAAIQGSTADILVFSDVATLLDRDGLRRIVRSFADPSVGCVSSEDRIVAADGSVSGEGAYVRYEMFLRALETQVGSVVGLSGSFFAARREVCRFWQVDIPSDFTTLLSSLRLGLRGISDPDAVGYYRDLADGRREYARKVRTIVRGLSAFLRHLEILNPWRFGVSSWQLFSHKLCRWLVPFGMIAALVSSLVLAPRSAFYAAAAVTQVAAYIVAAAGLASSTPPSGLRRIVAFFVLANVSILHAWTNVALGRRFVTWEPSTRGDLAEP